MMPESAIAETAATDTEIKLVLERLLPASPERVFDAWVNPEMLAKWWGPEGYSTPELSLNVETDGSWRTVMVAPDGEQHFVSGLYREIERPDRLVFTWGWETANGERGHDSEVEVTFRPAGSGTHLQLIHRRLESPTSRDSHRDGWILSLNCLERFVAE